MLTQFDSVLQHSISWLVQEMDSILVEQKAVNCVSEKAKWWEGRRLLDSRVKVSDKEQGYCWRATGGFVIRYFITSNALMKSTKTFFLFFFLNQVLTKDLIFLISLYLSETVKNDAGVAGMLSKHSFATFIRP